MVKVILRGPNKFAGEIELENWYRPDKYKENDDFLDTYNGYLRWVSRHRILGIYNAGVYHQGQTADDIAAYYNYASCDVIVRPKIIISEFVGAARYEADFELIDGSTLTGQFSISSEDEEIIFLNHRNHYSFEDEESPYVDDLMVVACTDVRHVSGNQYNSFTVVVDPPAVFLREIPIKHWRQTPFVLAFGYQIEEVFTYIDTFGWYFRMFKYTNYIYLQRAPWTGPFETPLVLVEEPTARDLSMWKDPSGAMYFEWVSDSGRHQALSYDGGKTLIQLY